MDLRSRLSACARKFAPVHLTTVDVTYRDCFVAARHGEQLDLVWATKTETALTDHGRVWSSRKFAGPGIDRVVVAAPYGLPGSSSTVTIRYPVCLGPRRGTLRTTGAGVVRGLVPPKPAAQAVDRRRP
jgi:hypothetical protein